MKTRLRLIYLLSASLLLLNGCTKKNTSMTPDKKKAAAAAQKETRTKSDTKTPTPTPTPLEPPVIQTPPEDGPSTTPTETPHGSAAATDSGGVAAPVKAPVPDPDPVVPPSSTISVPAQPQPADAPTTAFEKCQIGKVATVVSTLKTIAPKEPTPASFLAMKILLQKTCAIHLGDKAKDADFTHFETTKVIATEAMRSFPQFEPIIKFFYAVEINPAFAPEQKENIYKSYGSGAEISSKEIHFYGKLEGPKASTNVISYLITSATELAQLAFLPAVKNQTKTITDLKSTPKTTNRYTFDFTPTQSNTYALTISNGEAKIVVKVTFVKGDIKILRERKAVTVALTSESWSKVQEEHLRRLISSEAKELISMPFSLEREQVNMSLVRTCSLDADNIACTDPDFTSRAIVKSSAKASAEASARISADAE